MTREDFKAQVEDFVSLYCQDYMRDARAEYDFSDLDDLEGTVILEDMDGNEWRVPICEDCDGGVVISTDPQMWALDLDKGGLFAFLWVEAFTRLREKKCS